MINIDFSIIILVHNEEKTIGRLLDRLSEFVGGYTVEFIIIDSESEDGTPDIIKRKQKTTPNLKYLKIKKKEFDFGGTRNLGVRLAKGKYICFISGDATPLNKNSFKYFLEDFKLRKNVVTVFGKCVPYPDIPIFFKLEVICRENELAQQKLIFKNKFLEYYLSNVFACYKRSFLVKYPFKKTQEGFEDLFMGQLIIEKGFRKIYDHRCLVMHSHSYSPLEYYKQQKKDYKARLQTSGLKENPLIFCKIKAIWEMRISAQQKIYALLQLWFYYSIKLIAYLNVIFNKKWNIQKY